MEHETYKLIYANYDDGRTNLKFESETKTLTFYGVKRIEADWDSYDASRGGICSEILQIFQALKDGKVVNWPRKGEFFRQIGEDVIVFLSCEDSEVITFEYEDVFIDHKMIGVCDNNKNEEN